MCCSSATRCVIRRVLERDRYGTPRSRTTQYVTRPMPWLLGSGAQRRASRTADHGSLDWPPRVTPVAWPGRVSGSVAVTLRGGRPAIAPSPAGLGRPGPSAQVVLVGLPPSWHLDELAVLD